ncbi:MAG: DUF1295 domain-containing protein [Anaerolineae bacterium]|nr:DUF1295 domain-containing protein [Anaerolineae bacterium]
MGFWELYAAGAGVIWLCVTLLWLLSLWRRDASIVDIFWGSGFVILVWLWAALTAGDPLRRGLLLLAVTLWGLRLTLYLGWRNLGRGEDYRYAAWRRQYGPAWRWRSYAQVFLLQGGIMLLVALPLLAGLWAAVPAAPTLLDALGLLLWLVGFAFEAVGDWQLSRFRAQPQPPGRVLDTGLWRYTRHPNYFGDAVQWWGLFLLAAAAGGGWTVFSPLLMTFLLRRVSGVALLERSLHRTRPAYADYVRRTSAFFPLPPRGTPATPEQD